MRMWSSWNLETGESPSMTLELDNSEDVDMFRTIMKVYVQDHLHHEVHDSEITLALDILDSMEMPK